jgi:hypothetical protein
MDGLNAQVGWTEAQWNRVREEVLHAWQRVRVAGSFLPVYGNLPPSTQIVPSEIFKPDGTIDYQATAGLLEISLPVTLTRQQVREEDLSSALLQFRRRAMQVGQLEDWYVFNGAYPWAELLAQTLSVRQETVAYRPSSRFLDEVVSKWSFLSGAPKPIAGHATQKRGLLLRNPGSLGLIEGAKAVRGIDIIEWPPPPRKPDNEGLLRTVVNAINSLEAHGYVAPYVCVFGRSPFEEAHGPIDNSISFPRDRLEPLIGRELLHASAIDIAPKWYPPAEQEWPMRGVLLSLAGDAVDLAIAAEATPEFRHVDVEGHYIFSVFERFTLRIKDPKAIVPLKFEQPRPRLPKGRRRRLLTRDR